MYFLVFVEESLKKKKNVKNQIDYIKAIAVLKVNPRELRSKIQDGQCEDVSAFSSETIKTRTIEIRIIEIKTI